MDIENKRVLVTGGADGIGLAIARGFKHRGAVVYVTDLQADAVAAAQEEGFLAAVSDASDEQDVSEVMADVLRTMDGLDVLVNNVGIAGPTGPVEACPSDAWQRTFEVNVHSQFYCVKHALAMLRRGRRPSIINMSSAAGRLGMAGRSAYSASKWAVVGFTKTLAIELGPEGIRANAICPGAVEGPRIDAVIEAKAAMLGRSVQETQALYGGQSSMGRLVEPKDIADTAVFLASDMAAMVSGQAIAVDGHTEKLY
jgi:NAD(P)-dependent dehydrogenase (short-subunit alcohol dehydrogenase family)